jgi:HEAT repeat protein
MRASWFVILLTACASHNGRAVSLYESGDYAGAARAADEGLKAHPGDDGLWQMRIRAALALGDADAVTRVYGDYAKQRDGDDRDLLRDLAIATLGQALASPSAKLKIVAIEAVEAAELQSLADQVGERMGDDDDRVAATAAVAVLHGFPQAPQVASQMLHSENAEARRIAIDGIGKKVGALAAVDLAKAIGDSDPRVRRAAARWVGQLKIKDAADVLARRLRSDPDEAVRAAAATALARLATGDLAADAKQALADKALAVRLAAIDLVVAAKQTQLLAGLAEDPDPMLATEAAIALKRTDLAARALARAAASDSWTTRAGAANTAIRALGETDGQALVVKLLADKELEVRLAAARALAHSGRQDDAKRVFEAVSDQNVSAAADLADLGDARGLVALGAAVRDMKRGPDQRAQAASAHRLAHRVTPGLVGALADPNGVVRVEAASAIAVLAR